MAADAPQMATPASLESAREYVQRGWAVVSIPHREKAPQIPGWQNLRPREEDLPALFRYASNVGILLGEPSGGLVDIDLDAREAAIVAPCFLLPTALISGRANKPLSHRWYMTQPVPSSEKFCDLDGVAIVELRSTGQQTIVPPSIHPSNEDVRWESQGEPTRVSGEELRRATRLVASAALIARHWPAPGRRNDAANALAGMLFRAGFSEGEVERFVAAVAGAASDEEVRQRVRDVVSTAKRLIAGRTATGAPTLGAIIGDEAVRRIREWLRLDAEVEISYTAPSPLASSWPEPFAYEAFYGLPGEIVRAIEPHSEADPAALCSNS